MISTDLKEKVKSIRNELKAVGITSRQISIKSEKVLYDNSIEITIKDLNVKKSIVESVTNKYETIRYDEANGEVLQGCNTYINIVLDYDTKINARGEFLEIAKNIIEDSKEYINNSLFKIIEDNNKTVYYSAENKEIRLNQDSETIEKFNIRGLEGIADALVMCKYQYGISL